MSITNFIDLSVIRLKDGRIGTVIYVPPGQSYAYVELEGTYERLDVTPGDVEEVLWTP